MLATDGSPWRKCSGSPFDRYAQCRKDVKQPHQNSTPPSCVYSERYVTHPVSPHMHSSAQVLHDIMPWACGLLEIHFLIPFVWLRLFHMSSIPKIIFTCLLIDTHFSSCWEQIIRIFNLLSTNTMFCCNFFIEQCIMLSHNEFKPEVHLKNNW
jgi:hypothetical protein